MIDVNLMLRRLKNLFSKDGWAYFVFYLVKILRIERFLSDAVYLKLVFRPMMGYSLNLTKPRTFSEKLQWLKIYNRKPIYVTMVDKAAAKEFVANQIGDEFIIPTLGIYDDIDDIVFDSLPEQFVMKCTHDSGGLVICKDKSTLDVEAARRKIKKGLNNCFYFQSREWPYKEVPRRIIIEKYIVDESGYELKDYKFFCFHGEVKFFKIDFDRGTNHRANYYDVNMNILPIGENVCPPDESRVFYKPKNFDKMIEIAEILSKDIPFVRVDLYNSNGKIYFGELTFFPASGLSKYTSMECDVLLGGYLNL